MCDSDYSMKNNNETDGLNMCEADYSMRNFPNF